MMGQNSNNRPFSYCIDQAGLGAFTAKSGRKHYNPPPLTVMWMNFDSPNFPSLCSLSAIISFQTCSNKCILYVLLFHKCIKIKYKTVNIYGVFLWLVQSSPETNRWWVKIVTIDHSHIVSIRPGWAHSQRRVGVNITIPLHWPSCEWTLTLPIFRWNTIHSHRNYHVQLLSVWVGEFCHPARSR